MLLAVAGPVLAAPPAITSPGTVDLYYNVEIPGDIQFSHRVVATGAAVTFEATGLPANTTIDRDSGWIIGSRNVPGIYDVAVRATNAEGSTATTVRLAIHPATIGVRSSAGTYRAGQNFSVTLNYNAAVTVTGAPRLALAIGPLGAAVFKDAVYVSGSGTSELVFSYAVVAGDDDADGVQLLPSAPVGGTIRDATGLLASPSLPVRHFVSGITIAAGSGPGSAPVTVSTAAAPAPVAAAQLMNVSARMHVSEGDAARSLIAGFVVTGTQPMKVLLRAIGPGLSGFGVAGALADPGLKLYSSAGALVAENDNWEGSETSAVAAGVGAFALTVGARDSAVTVTLPPGAYTLVVSPKGGDGVALAEVYAADQGASTISNLSTRGQIDGSGSPLIAGFAVQGTAPRRMLIRGIGPSLALFGVGATLQDPTLKIYRDGQLVAENDNWTTAGAENATAAAASGAFALGANSKDAAIVLTLEPGSYTAVVSGGGEASGAGLVEVYELAATS